MTTDLASRVDAGARLLDEKRPGWHREIAMDVIAMKDCDKCILGQVYGGFEIGLAELFGDADGWESEDIDHGFNAGSIFKMTQEFDSLADLWRAEIRKRLEAEA